MRSILFLTAAVLLTQLSLSQTIVKMKKKEYNFVIPCLVNGMQLTTSVDTTEDEASISLQEVIYMLDNNMM